MRGYHRRTPLAVVAAAALVLTACAGGAGGTTSGGAGTSAPAAGSAAAGASASPSAAAAAAPPTAPAPSASPAARASAPAAAPSEAAAAGAPIPTVGGPLQNVKLIWVAKVANMAPAWLALDAGYFKQQGLNVSLSYVNGSPNGMAALLSGDTDFLEAAGTAVVQAAAASKNAQQSPELVIGTVNRAVFKLEVQPSITSIAQLKGKNLCITLHGSADDIAMRVFLEQNHLDPDKDVSLITGGTLAGCTAALETGRVAGGAFSTPVTALLAQKGFKALADFAKQGVQLQQLGVSVTRSYAASHKDTILRFTRAYIEGIHRWKVDPAFSKQELTKYLDIKDPAQLQDAYQTYVEGFEQVPIPTNESLQNVISSVPAAKGMPPTAFYDPSFVKQLQDDGFIKQVYGSS